MKRGADAAYPFALPGDDDRLAELGRLAGGLVHELKNPLGTILLNVELMQQQLRAIDLPAAERERLDKRLGRVTESGRSLQAIVQSFLSYARPARPDRDAVDVNRLLRELLDEQAPHLQSLGIHAAFHPDEGLCLLPADRQQLRSVFLNVIANACDALGERPDDRRLLLMTRAGKGLVRVVVANNGPPLPERIAAHLFEPFTSTKEHGTGLGLAIVRRLVELHRGTVSVASDRDQGVSFSFEFPTPLGPALHRAELPMPEVEAAVRPAPAPRRSSPRQRRKTGT